MTKDSTYSLKTIKANFNIKTKQKDLKLFYYLNSSKINKIIHFCNFFHNIQKLHNYEKTFMKSILDFCCLYKTFKALQKKTSSFLYMKHKEGPHRFQLFNSLFYDFSVVIIFPSRSL